MRVAVMLLVFLFALHACNLVGEGTWSDTQGNSGSLVSEFMIAPIGMPSGKKENVITYRVEFDDGSEVVVKFVVGPAKENPGRNLLLDFSGKVIGTARPATENSDSNAVIEIDDEKIELLVTADAEHNMDVAGKKTYQDGRILTWKDIIKVTPPDDF